MRQRAGSTIGVWIAVAVLGFAAGGCGGDDDASPATGDPGSGSESDGSEDVPTDEGGAIEGSASDDDLIVPRAYLQGEWCDGDGQSWTIDGDTARMEDGSGGTGEFPVDIVFIAGPGVELVSQTDDEFVFGTGDDQVTFTRGSC